MVSTEHSLLNRQNDTGYSGLLIQHAVGLHFGGERKVQPRSVVELEPLVSKQGRCDGTVKIRWIFIGTDGEKWATFMISVSSWKDLKDR